MADPDEVMAGAGEALERARARRGEVRQLRRARRGYERGTATIGKRLTGIAIVDAGILLVAMMIGLVHPIGMFGALGVLMLMIAATLAIAVAPVDRRPPPDPVKLRQADLKALPAQTERWLAAQRPALPAPAITLVDRIGLRLDTLSPQLAAVDDDSDAAAEIRKLVGEQLPAFVGDYTKVPAALRSVPRNGKTPDAQLVDGLSLIEQEIGEMTAKLAQGDLDSLATRGRYLEIRYRGDAGDN